MKIVMKNVSFSFVATMFLLLSFETASACSCIGFVKPPTPKEVRMQFNNDLKRASVVFSGEVIQLDEFKVAFRVEKVWKGETVEEITMSTGTINKGNGIITVSSCDYSFKIGEKYLVYATGEGEKMQTYKCTGTGELKNSEDRIKILEAISHKKAALKS